MNRKPVFIAIIVVFAGAALLPVLSTLLSQIPVTVTTTVATTPTTSTKTTSTSSATKTQTASITTTVIGGMKPPGYTMGDFIDVDLKSGMGVLYIKQLGEKVSVRFTAKFSGDANMLTFYALRSAEQPTVRVGLQDDRTGTPSGRWVGEEGFGVSRIPNKDGFVTINLQRTTSISKGGVYHLVIEPADTTVKEPIVILTYPADCFAQPYNIEDPDIIWPDKSMNVLSYDGEDWKEENRWPIYVVGYSDGSNEGQPYSLAAPWVIHNRTYVGQTIIPASGYKIGKIAFVVGLKNQPKDRLYYEIRNSGNQMLAKGLFAEAGQLTTWEEWVEVSLPVPVNLEAGTLYRIVLLSPGTDLDNAYLVYGHEFTYDASIGYGGLQHQLTASHDAGLTWYAWTDADAIFKLITVP